MDSLRMQGGQKCKTFLGPEVKGVPLLGGIRGFHGPKWVVKVQKREKAQ